jgi:hypothetical protein
MASMPSFVAPLLGFVLGLAFAWAAIEELSSDPTSVLGSRSLVVSMLFSLLVFAPMAGYFMAFHGDWSVAYFINARRLPSAVILAMALFNALTVPVGFVLGAPLARQKQLKKLLTLAGIPSLLAMLLVLLLARRLSVSATYTQFKGDFGYRSIAGTALGYAVMWMNGVLATAVALTVREIRRISLATRPH